MTTSILPGMKSCHDEFFSNTIYGKLLLWELYRMVLIAPPPPKFPPAPEFHVLAAGSHIIGMRVATVQKTTLRVWECL